MRLPLPPSAKIRTPSLPPSVLHFKILEKQAQRPCRNPDFDEAEGQGNHHQHQAKCENPSGGHLFFPKQQKHAKEAHQETGYAKSLHEPDKVQPLAKVLDLFLEHIMVFLLVAVVKVADEVGYRQKLVGIGQQQQRNRREKQGWGSEGKLHITAEIVKQWKKAKGLGEVAHRRPLKLTQANAFAQYRVLKQKMKFETKGHLYETVLLKRNR